MPTVNLKVAAGAVQPNDMAAAVVLRGAEAGVRVPAIFNQGACAEEADGDLGAGVLASLVDAGPGDGAAGHRLCPPFQCWYAVPTMRRMGRSILR